MYILSLQDQYTLVLGLPFWIGISTNEWRLSTILGVALASVGPWLYKYLNKQAERVLLEDIRKTQIALKQFSEAVFRIKDIEELLKEVEYKAYSILKPEYAVVHKITKENTKFSNEFTESLLNKKQAVSVDEIQNINNTNNNKLNPSSVIIPFITSNYLYAILEIGPRKNKLSYSDEDFDVFNILSKCNTT